jgi:hypothetical protein
MDHQFADFAFNRVSRLPGLSHSRVGRDHNVAEIYPDLPARRSALPHLVGARGGIRRSWKREHVGGVVPATILTIQPPDRGIPYKRNRYLAARAGCGESNHRTGELSDLFAVKLE